MLVQDDSVRPARPAVHPYHTVYNREAVIPPMCYTRTESRHNPCYVCHQDAIKGRPNQMDDGGLQRAYSFSDVGLENHWQNLLADRSARVAAVSDADILTYINQDNYSELAQRLRAIDYEGFIPDLTDLQLGAEAFDAEGFARDGSGWVAFNYKPMPSTFWPTNGSTDDVMIRLPKPFRSSKDGQPSRDVYKANLALVEANLKAMPSITVANVDERLIGKDLDGDGQLGMANSITETDGYVGAAEGSWKLPMLYPQYTEFLHSVRYVGVDDVGNIFVPKRMKELRYMRKQYFRTLPHLFEMYEQEKSAKMQGELPGYVDRGDAGLDNEMGWILRGFIEGPSGRLRLQNYEEQLYCMGCHTSVGSTVDSTFSFLRKVDGAAGWGYIDLRGMPDAPSKGEARGEIATYLQRAGGGGEFRSNPEMEARFFRHGVVADEKVTHARDVYELITPSRSRALRLNKAYRTIVQDPDFVFGRIATVTPPANVHREIDNGEMRPLPKSLTYVWDIRLEWGAVR